MALRLTVISEQSAELGDTGSIVLGVGGGNIGRARDNDWVLPDPQRYLSSHHARVQFRRGTFFIEDTSTNGVFVNDATQALARRGPHALAHGDVLRLGAYRVRVDIDGSAESQTGEASSVYAVGEMLPELQKLSRSLSTRNDIGSDLDVAALLSPGEAPAPPRPRVEAPPLPSVPVAVSAPSTNGALTNDDALLKFDQAQSHSAEQSRSGEHARVTPPPRAGANLQAAPGAAHRISSGAAAFCRGAGIDPQRFPEDTHAKLLYLGGLLLREALVGLKGLALAQHDIQATLQVAAPGSESRPTLRNAPIDDLLVQLLAGHERRELDALMWLREKISMARRHDEAMARSMYVALAEFVARLDPRELSIGAERHRVNGSANLDDTLAHRFRSITESSSGGLPHLYAEAFTQAFQEELRRNGAPARSRPETPRGESR
ncbi:MAG: type VI secretion system-associated FHA domain protein TagH [Steroidobacteraceae bacterium]